MLELKYLKTLENVLQIKNPIKKLSIKYFYPLSIVCLNIFINRNSLDMDVWEDSFHSEIFDIIPIIEYPQMYVVLFKVFFITKFKIILKFKKKSYKWQKYS